MASSLSFLSKDEYIDLVRARAAAGPYLEERLTLVRSKLPSDEREANLRETMEVFQFDPKSGRAGLLQIVPLGSAKAALERDGFKVENWHFDRTAGCLLINLQGGRHEALSAALYDAYRGSEPTRNLATSAELFIDEGLGWFRSSSSFGRALKGSGVKLTSQEETVFGRDFMHMD
jgi:hypothetical protein